MGERTAAALLVVALILTGCGGTPEQKLRKTLAATVTGRVTLPPGVIEISSELVPPPGAHDFEITGPGATLKAAQGFKGRALLVIDGARNVHLRDFKVDGNRSVLDRPLDMAQPGERISADAWYPLNRPGGSRRGLEIVKRRAGERRQFPGAGKPVFGHSHSQPDGGGLRLAKPARAEQFERRHPD